MTSPRRHPLLLVLLAALSCACALPLRAAAEDSPEWQFSEYTDQGHVIRQLIYGVPESDDIRVVGDCDTSKSSSSASVTFGADIGNLETGKDVELRFSGGGFDYALKGQIYRAEGEEGMSGVRADIALDDPLWRAFAEKDSLDYLVPGYKAATIDLTRGRDKIAAFLQACKGSGTAAASPPSSVAAAGHTDKDDFESAKELGTAEAWQAFLAAHPSGFYADLARAYLNKLTSGGTPQTAVASPADVPDPSCADVKTLRTTSSAVPTKLTVVNKSGVDRILRWIDERGRIEDYGTVKAGQQVTVDTFLDNPWLITNEDGRICFQVFMPHAGGRVVEFTGGSAVSLWEVPQEKPAAKKVTTNKSAGCGKGKISIQGRCIRKSDAVGFCGPGYHPEGGKCKPGYIAPKHPKSVHGCPRGQAWSPEEGCHEDD